MSPTPRRRSRSSRRWARPSRVSRISRCWSAPAARRCPSALGSIVAADPARGRHRAAGARLLSRQDRHLGSRRAGRRWMAGATNSRSSKIGRAPAHFVPAELAGAQRQDCCTRCPTRRWRRGSRRMGIAGGRHSGRRRGPILRGFGDAAAMWQAGVGAGDAGDRGCGFAAKAAAAAAARALGRDDLEAWTAAVAAATGAKGRALFHPLRLALTGREHGPELKKLLPLIGRAKGFGAARGEAA